jgi:chromosome segregation ATPase
MKRFIQLLFIVVIIIQSTSCTEKYKKEIERLTAITDSLESKGVEKDTITMSYVKAFNAIQRNLDEIKMKEKLITQLSDADPEQRKSQEEEINRDIEAIYELLLKNKQIVDDLRKQLRGAGKKRAELEQMIASLNGQIETKDAEISQLKEDLSNKQLVIRNLEKNLAAMETLSMEKEAVISQQIVEKNTVWYIIGNKKYLEEQKIVTKEGGFIGLGKSRKVSENFDKSLFTMADQRDILALPVFSKKARLLTIHPAASYQLSGEDSIDSLRILHPDDFWSASRYLVVMID